MAHTGFSFTPLTGTNRLTCTSNVTTARRSFGLMWFGWSEAVGSPEPSSMSFRGLSQTTANTFWIGGMNSTALDAQTPTALRVEISDDTLSVELSDGRSIAVPLVWF